MLKRKRKQVNQQAVAQATNDDEELEVEKDGDEEEQGEGAGEGNDSEENEDPTPSAKRARKRKVLARFPAPRHVRIPPASWSVPHAGPLGVVTWNVAHLGAIGKNPVEALKSALADYDQRRERLPEEARKAVHPLEHFFRGDKGVLLDWFGPEDEPEEATQGASMETSETSTSEPLRRTRPMRKASASQRVSLPEKKIRDALKTLQNDDNNAVARLMVIATVLEIFENNPWIHAVVLQEVNLGMPQLQEAVESVGLEFHAGPQLMSANGLTPQYEYYPLILRPDSGLSYQWTYVIPTDGPRMMMPLYTWNKSEGNYRPVVVHELLCGATHVHLAVLHTTPGEGADEYEFHRREEYLQLRNTFEQANAMSDAANWWIICGDYYLTREARVVSPEDLSSDALWRGLRKEYEENDEEEEDEQPRRTEMLREYNRFSTLQLDALGQKLGSLKTTVRKDDLLRNRFGLTFEAQLPRGLAMTQAVSGSNWHGRILQQDIPSNARERADYFATARIADFFVYSREQLSSLAVGILRPSGGISLVDTADLQHSRYWNRVSDHFPVGALFVPRGTEAQHAEALRQVVANAPLPDQEMEALQERRLLRKTLVILAKQRGMDQAARSKWMSGQSEEQLRQSLEEWDEGPRRLAQEKAARKLGVVNPWDFGPSIHSKERGLELSSSTSGSSASSAPPRSQQDGLPGFHTAGGAVTARIDRVSCLAQFRNTCGQRAAFNALAFMNSPDNPGPSMQNHDALHGVGPMQADIDDDTVRNLLDGQGGDEVALVSNLDHVTNLLQDADLIADEGDQALYDFAWWRRNSVQLVLNTLADATAAFQHEGNARIGHYIAVDLSRDDEGDIVVRFADSVFTANRTTLLNNLLLAIESIVNDETL